MNTTPLFSSGSLWPIGLSQELAIEYADGKADDQGIIHSKTLNQDINIHKQVIHDLSRTDVLMVNRNVVHNIEYSKATEGEIFDAILRGSQNVVALAKQLSKCLRQDLGNFLIGSLFKKKKLFGKATATAIEFRDNIDIASEKNGNFKVTREFLYAKYAPTDLKKERPTYFKIKAIIRGKKQHLIDGKLGKLHFKFMHTAEHRDKSAAKEVNYAFTVAGGLIDWHTQFGPSKKGPIEMKEL